VAENEERFESPAGRELNAWEKAFPGGAEKLYQEWSKTLAHQRRIESRNAWITYLGASLGFMITMAFLAATVYLVRTGHAISGTILGTVDLAALVSVFVIGIRER
jgi:hypothetical protein